MYYTLQPTQFKLMKPIYLLVLSFLLLGCANERVLELPEIENAEITEVLDVSPAYIFYDESQPDSTLFNRKNLIGTTNWLVNVDRRLSLKQAVPHLLYLQNKRRKASMHKNEAAKNYFTCHNTSSKNLGFIDFTDTSYLAEDLEINDNSNEFCHLIVESMDDIMIRSLSNKIYEVDFKNLEATLSEAFKEDPGLKKLSLWFNENLSFQDYVDIKNSLLPFAKNTSNIEFVFKP